MAKEYVNAKTQLTESEKRIIRSCPGCEGEMTATARVIEDSSFILRDNGIVYTCNTCGESIVLPSYSTLMLKFMTLLMSVGIVVIMFIYKYWGLILDMLKESIGFAALAVFILGILLILVFGGLVNGVGFFLSLKKLIRYPVISGGSVLRMFALFIITLLYGLIPWAIFMGTGFLNDYYWHIDDEWVTPFIILGLVPIFIAPKVGISVPGAFFATASYPFFGLLFYFFS